MSYVLYITEQMRIYKVGLGRLPIVSVTGAGANSDTFRWLYPPHMHIRMYVLYMKNKF